MNKNPSLWDITMALFILSGAFVAYIDLCIIIWQSISTIEGRMLAYGILAYFTGGIFIKR